MGYPREGGGGPCQEGGMNNTLWLAQLVGGFRTKDPKWGAIGGGMRRGLFVGAESERGKLTYLRPGGKKLQKKSQRDRLRSKCRRTRRRGNGSELARLSQSQA